MVNISKLYQDPALEKQGVWIEHSAGFSMRIARGNTQAFERACFELLEPLREKIRAGALSSEDRQRALLPAICEHIITDWKDIEGDDGKPLAFSVKAAFELLSRPELRDLLDWIVVRSNDAALFKKRAQEAAKGN